MIRKLLVIVVASGAVILAHAPPPPQAQVAFEVVSIKRNPNRGPVGPDGARSIRAVSGGSGFEMNDGSVVALIRYAYPTISREVRGGPDWVASERFDVSAKAAGPMTRPQLEAMVRALLADRFALRASYQIVERPIYKLVVARPDGRLGPKITRATADCNQMRAARARGELPPPLPAKPTCSWVYGGGHMAAGGVPLSDLTRIISADAGRVVIDATGLEGDYEFELEWNPIPLSDQPVDRPSLFVAVEEQLGLRLQPDRGVVEIVVIEEIERPTPD